MAGDEVESLRLDQVCVEIVDCPHSTPKLEPGGPALLARTQDVRRGVFDIDGAARVGGGTYEARIARAEPRHGDLLYSREGTYFGVAAEVPRGVKVCLGQRMVLLRPDPEHVDYRYLRHWLNSSAMSAYVAGLRDGSVAERLNLSTIRALPVRVRPLQEQRRVADVLGVLEDKIDINRKTNETLEAMARALFKSWFVDFDPVRAKAEGRHPAGMDADTAKLFPSSFEDSELGKIPKGWRVARVGAALELQYGRALREAERRGGAVTVYGSNGAIGRHDRPQAKGPGVIVGRKGNPGTVVWAQGDFVVIDTAFYVVPKLATPCLHFIRESLALLELPRLAADSAVPGISREAIYAERLLLPPADLIGAFERLSMDVQAAVHQKLGEASDLATLRDAMLPRLLSGELRV